MEVKEETGEGKGGGLLKVEGKDEPPEESVSRRVVIRVKVEKAVEEDESEEEYIFDDFLEGEDGRGHRGVDPLGSADEGSSGWVTRNVRLRPRRTSGRCAVSASSGEESEDGGDSDWVPDGEGEDPRGGPPTKKRNVDRTSEQLEQRRRSGRESAKLPRAAMTQGDRERKKEWNRERMRQLRLKKKDISGVVKTEPEEEEALKRKRSAERKRAKRASLPPEEREKIRERDRERARARYRKMKGMSGTEDGSTCEDVKGNLGANLALETSGQEQKSLALDEAALKRKRRAERERAKRASLPPEEREKIRKRDRERARARHLRLKEMRMSGTKAESTCEDVHVNLDADLASEAVRGEQESLAVERRKRRAERDRAKRASLPPEEREKIRKRDRERARARHRKLKGLSGEMVGEAGAGAAEDESASQNGKGGRAPLTQQQIQDRARQKVLDHIMRRAAMTDEEVEKRRQHYYFKYQAKLARMTPEEQKAKNKSFYARRLEKYGPEGLREQRQRAWREMDPEKKARMRETFRQNAKRRLARFKEDPEKYEEFKRRQRELQKARQVSADSRRDPGTAKPKVPKHPPLADKAAEKEKQAKLQRLWSTKCRLVNKLDLMKQILSGGHKTFEQFYQQSEASKRREQNCLRQRICKAKQKLEETLEAEGATQEEIAQRLEEVEENYKNNFSGARAYKPRYMKNSVKPEDIAEVERKIEEVDKLKELLWQGQNVSIDAVVGTRTRKTKKAREKEVAAKNLGQDKPSTPRKKGEPPSLSGQLPGPSLLTVTQLEISSREPTLPYIPPPTVDPSHQNGSISDAQANYPDSSYAVSASSSQHEDEYANSNSFDDDMPLSPGDNSANSENSFQSQTEISQKEQPSNTEPVMDLSSGFPPQQQETCQEPSDTSTPPVPPKRGRGRPRKGEVVVPARKNRKTKWRRRRTTDIAKETICDQCGESRVHISRHKHYYHNPHYDQPSKTCKLCRQSFSSDPLWYSHYIKAHRVGRSKGRKNKLNPFGTVICDQCGGAYNDEQTLKVHKRQVHNPNYDLVNRKCKICGESYAHGQIWHKHYLDAHVRPSKPKKEKRHVCELCGGSFQTLFNYNHHKYYQHGEGSKTENFLKCALCPGERLIKTKDRLISHFKRFHPEAEYRALMQHECGRCPDKFLNEKDLCKHVRENHPESCFVCQYCKMCRFSQLGLNFHYAGCTKISKEERKRVEGEWSGEFFTVEGLPLKCELCEKQTKLFNLTRHYKNAHGVTENRFECELCRRRFSGRYVWANHLEEMHGKTVEELGRFVNKLNAENREGLVCQPKRMRKKRRKELESEDEEEHLTKRRPRRVAVIKKKRRRIVVICEEDKVEAGLKVKEEVEEFAEVKVESEVECSSSAEDEESSWCQSE